MVVGKESEPAKFRTHMPLQYRVVLAAIGAASALIALAAGPSPWLVVSVAAVFLAGIMTTLRVLLGEAGPSVRVAGIFSTSIAYEDIAAVSVGPETGLREGMGLRILPGGGTGYFGGRPIRSAPMRQQHRACVVR